MAGEVAWLLFQINIKAKVLAIACAIQDGIRLLRLIKIYAKIIPAKMLLIKKNTLTNPGAMIRSGR